MRSNKFCRLFFLCQMGVMAYVSTACGQTPICAELRYGTPTQAAAIEQALYKGTVAESVAAIRAAQATRGTDLGCAEVAYPVTAASAAAPSLASIRSAWAEQLVAAEQSLDTYDRCPAIGRGAGAYGLGGWSARSGGLSFPEAPLRAFADNFLATQYGGDKTR